MTGQIIPADLARQMMGHGVSSGYLRLGGSVPDKLVPADKFTPFEVRIPGDLTIENPRAIADSPPALELGPPEYPTSTAEARAKGYTGDQCHKCNGMHMQWAGHCLVCADCGETTGCS